jgi:hypothetical protein
VLENLRGINAASGFGIGIAIAFAIAIEERMRQDSRPDNDRDTDSDTVGLDRFVFISGGDERGGQKKNREKKVKYFYWSRVYHFGQVSDGSCRFSVMVPVKTLAHLPLSPQFPIPGRKLGFRSIRPDVNFSTLNWKLGTGNPYYRDEG